MPGHIKKAKEGEVDPDPLPYLVVTLEMKRADAQIPYDPKKSYYCPDGKHGYMECMLESLEGDKATVMCGHEVIKRYKELLVKFNLALAIKRCSIIKYILSLFLSTEKGLQSLRNWPSQPKEVRKD